MIDVTILPDAAAAASGTTPTGTGLPPRGEGTAAFDVTLGGALALAKGDPADARLPKAGADEADAANTLSTAVLLQLLNGLHGRTPAPDTDGAVPPDDQGAHQKPDEAGDDQAILAIAAAVPPPPAPPPVAAGAMAAAETATDGTHDAPGSGAPAAIPADTGGRRPVMPQESGQSVVDTASQGGVADDVPEPQTAASSQPDTDPQPGDGDPAAANRSHVPPSAAPAKPAPEAAQIAATAAPSAAAPAPQDAAPSGRALSPDSRGAVSRIAARAQVATSLEIAASARDVRGQQQAGLEAPAPAARAATAVSTEGGGRTPGELVVPAADAAPAPPAPHADAAPASRAATEALDQAIQGQHRDARSGGSSHRESQSQAGAADIEWLRRSAALESRLAPPPSFTLPASLVQHPAPAAAIAGGAAAALVPTFDTPVPAENLSRLVQSIRVQARDGVSQANVRLHPEHLGEVSIAIRVESGTVTAVVRAEAGDVRQWLRGQEEAIRTSLADQGLTLDELVVEDDGRREQHEQQAEEQQRRGRTRRRTPAATFEVVA